MNVQNYIQKQFNKFKNAKNKYELAKKEFLNSLPENVQSEYHYNGLQGIKHNCSEYYQYLVELK